jgi:hypothetical protein
MIPYGCLLTVLAVADNPVLPDTSAKENPPSKAIAKVVEQLGEADSYSFVLGVKGGDEVLVNVRDLPGKSAGRIREVKPGRWEGDRWYGQRQVPRVIENAFGEPSKGKVYLKVTLKDGKESHTFTSRGTADDSYVLGALGMRERFAKWSDKEIPDTDDVQSLPADRLAAKEARLTPALKPAVDLATATYDAKRAELVKRFNRSFLYYPEGKQLTWTVYEAKESLYLESSCSDRMYSVRFRVELRPDKDGKWEYVRLLTEEKFKGE